MIKAKEEYYKEIDKTAKGISGKFNKNELITNDVLNTIIKIYQSAKVEESFKDNYFESAYHTPITGDLEFFIARILYHVSKELDKQWIVLLRCQKDKSVPDIRLVKNNKTFAIIEIKAKAGWIQPFLSPERYKRDMRKFNAGGSSFNPNDLIEKSRKQLDKYAKTFNVSKKDIFLLLPTLALVHRKKYETKLNGYYTYFSTTSNLPKKSLVLLSRNMRLDLSNVRNELLPSNDFENLLNKLKKY